MADANRYVVELTDADVDALYRSDVPVWLLTALISFRIAVNQTAVENLTRRLEKEAHVAPKETCPTCQGRGWHRRTAQAMFHFEATA